MTTPLFRQDAYLRTAPGRVAALRDGGVVLEASLFYPTSGGQAGDVGRLTWPGGDIAVTGTVKSGETGADILLQPAEGADLPPIGQGVVQTLDWDARHKMMRLHTGLHLLSVVIPLPVTGGAITPLKGRLDFDMAEAPGDKQALEDRLNQLISKDLPVNEEWITDAELDANPGLVKTLSVQPPRGSGRVRLVRIGAGEATIDLQPCGGTHVRSTGEIGAMRLGKIEKKGRQNRRVSVSLG